MNSPVDILCIDNEKIGFDILHESIQYACKLPGFEYLTNWNIIDFLVDKRELDNDEQLYYTNILQKVDEINPDAVLVDLSFSFIPSAEIATRDGLEIADDSIRYMNGLRLIERISNKYSGRFPIFAYSQWGGILNGDQITLLINRINESGGIPLWKHFLSKEETTKRFFGKINREITRKRDNTIEHDNELGFILGTSLSERTFKELILVCSEADAPVLITGESGVGKEEAAKAIHNNSNRKQEPFEQINCAAIPDTLLDAELFGTAKGAYNDAVERDGLFKAADKGTIFLDEIGNMSAAMQNKLLTAIEKKAFRKLGSTEEIHVDVRIICATNENIKRMIEEGKFRNDLYQRINTVQIHIKPLRERKEIITPLTKHFLGEYNKTTNNECLKYLNEKDWKGSNIRGLRAICESAAVLSRANNVVSLEYITKAIEMRNGVDYNENNTSKQRKEATADLSQIESDRNEEQQKGFPETIADYVINMVSEGCLAEQSIFDGTIHTAILINTGMITRKNSEWAKAASRTIIKILLSKLQAKNLLTDKGYIIKGDKGKAIVNPPTKTGSAKQKLIDKVATMISHAIEGGQP